MEKGALARNYDEPADNKSLVGTVIYNCPGRTRSLERGTSSTQREG